MDIRVFHLLWAGIISSINCNICPINNQSFSIETNCSAFYNCTSGKPIFTVCPKGTLFDVLKQECLPRIFTIGCQKDYSVQLGQYIQWPDVDYKCKVGTKVTVGEGNLYSACIDKYYFSTTSCSYYHTFCNISLACYDKRTQKCDAKAFPKLPAREKITGDPKVIGMDLSEFCPEDRSSFSIKNNCSAYYNCSTGYPYYTVCPIGTYFDCLNQQCSKNVFYYCCEPDSSANFYGQDMFSYSHPCKDNASTISNDYTVLFTCINNQIYGAEMYTAEYNILLWCNLTKSYYNSIDEKCTYNNPLEYPLYWTNGEATKCPINNQSFPIATRCSAFYNCSSGKPVFSVCPPGKYFDTLKQECQSKTFKFSCNHDKAVNASIFYVDFASKPNPPEEYTCKNGTKLDKYGVGFVACVNNSFVNTKCDWKSSERFCNISLECYDPKQQRCDVLAFPKLLTIEIITATPKIIGINPNESCPDGRSPFPIKNNCSAYYNCTAGCPYLTVCPPGTYYDCMRQQCSKKTFYHCCREDTTANFYANETQPSYAFPCKNGAIAMNGQFQIYICQNNRVYTMDKPFKWYCNLSSSFIYYFNNQKCINNIQPPNCSALVSQEPICLPDTLTISVWFNCSLFIDFNGAASAYICPNNLLFNGFSKCCVDPTMMFTSPCIADRNKPLINNNTCSPAGKRQENPTSIDSYFECNRTTRRIEKKSCTYGQLFDWQKKKCNDYLTAVTIPGYSDAFNYCMQIMSQRDTFCSPLKYSQAKYSNCIANYCKLVGTY